MSWISDNYEKAAIGGAAVIALAFGASIISNKGAVEEAFVRDSVKRNDDVSVPSLPKIKEVEVSLGKVHIHGKPKTKAGREVNLMIGVPLFAKRGELGNPVDLPVSAPVHAPIPNSWWLDNDIDPCYSDSPELDPDEDGFSNKEEFLAKTDPNKFDSHPDLITKLKVVSVKTTRAHLKPSDYGSGKMKFKLQTSSGRDKNKMGPDPIAAGQPIVFVKPLMQKRFKFKALEEKKVQKNGIMQNMKVWVIEDLKPNKKGQEYRFDKRGRRIGGGSLGIVDSTVELSLKALKQGGNMFKIEENISFSLPYDEKSTKKPYLLKKVDLEAKTAEVEYTDQDGKKKSHIMSYAK